MVKNILSVVLCAALLTSVPMVSVASNMIEIVDMADIDTNGIVITVNQNILHVSGANGQNLQIYNVAGVCVKSIKVEGDECNFDLNLQKGCYLIKVGKIVRKISIR